MARKEELIQTIISNAPDRANTVRTAQALHLIVNGWESGLSNINALAAECGVSASSLKSWMDDEAELFEELKNICYVNCNTIARKNILKALKKGSIETSKWFLERTDNEFSKKDTPPQVNVALISVAEREKALAEYMEKFVIPEDTTPTLTTATLAHSPEEKEEATDE